MKFNLKTVSEQIVQKILRQFKPKKSCRIDSITSEILKIGSEVLVVPLTYIINYSIVTGKYPTNYRPVALLAVAGMILEKVVALQIEEYFEKNNL